MRTIDEESALKKQVVAMLLSCLAACAAAQLFAQRQAAPDAVDAVTQHVGLLQARLRGEHLKTHLAQTALLEPRQVQQYVQLSGYTDGAHPERHKH